MDVERMETGDDFVPMASTLPTILCCLCGTAITANAAKMCVSCLRGQVDITESIPKQSSVYYCRGCARYLQPPKHWVAAELESKELLTICLKRLKGLNKEFIVEYVVEYQQCDMCCRDAADVDEWQAVVQARQKVPHKLGMKLFPDDINFYFMNRSQGLKFISFLNHVVPVRYKTAEHLVSHDANSNTYRYKYTFSTEIVPLCKDDLLCLPPKLSSHLGGLGPIVIVTRISQSITVTDPQSLQSGEISSALYWKYPMSPMMTAKQATEFVIMDVDSSNLRRGKWCLADATVARSKDYGRNDNTSLIRTHLGNLLNPGDLALGYDVGNAVYNDRLLEGYKRLEIPDVLLFKKTYEKADRTKQRKWRLQRLNMQLDDSMVEAPSRRRGERGTADPLAMMQEEQEEFMQELEQDADLRSTINLFKANLTISGDDGAVAATAPIPPPE
eukprot:IDg9904t1